MYSNIERAIDILTLFLDWVMIMAMLWSLFNFFFKSIMHVLNDYEQMKWYDTNIYLIKTFCEI